MKQLTENHFTELGTREFFEHTRLMTMKVGELINDVNPVVTTDETIHDCLVKMTVGGFGAATIVDEKQKPIGVFTDGDLRRMIEKEGSGSIDRKISDLPLKTPVMIEANELLIKASEIFKENQVDTLIVTVAGKAAGMLDIQDLMKLSG